MPYSFYEDDDEDDLNRYLERFASGGRDELAYDPGYGYRASDYGGGGGGVSAPIPVREDNRSWLEKNGFPLLMAAGSVAAAFADKSGRRGQNVQHALGQIAGAQMRSEQADRDSLSRDFELDRRAWQQQQGLDMNRELAGQRMAGDDADRELRAADQALRGRQSDELHQRYMQSNDPSSPANKLALQQAQADLDYKQARAYSEWTQDPNAITPAQEREYQLRERQLADQAAGRTAANEDRDLQRQLMADQRALMNDQRAETAHQRQLNKFRDETEKSRPQLTRAMEVEELVRRNPGDIPGVGRWDSIKGKIPIVGEMLSSRDDLAMRGNLTDMADLILRERSGAAAPPVEVLKLAENIAAGGGATEKEFAVLQGEYNRLLRSGLQQQAVGREDVAREVLGGRADWALGPQAPQPAAPQPGAGDTVRLGQGQRGAPSGGRVNFPQDGAAGGPVMMQNPATGDSGPVPPDMVSAAEAAGWRRL